MSIYNIRAAIKRFFCKHNEGMRFVRNIYGDEIIEYGYKRSIWICHRCGGVVLQDLPMPSGETAGDTTKVQGEKQ